MAEAKEQIRKTLGLQLDDSEFGIDFLFMIRDNNDEASHV
jgi:hypothetical protein